MKFSRMIKPELEMIIENANFSDEELEIFRLLSRDTSIIEIANRVGMSERTVYRKQKKIYDKYRKVCEMHEEMCRDKR